MFWSNTFKGAVAIAAVAVATAAPASMAGATPGAGPGPNLSFSASTDGASAGWTAGKGSTIELTLGTTGGSFAAVTIHHDDGMAIAGLNEPRFTTDNYRASSPRYYITLSNDHTLWGYPPNAGLNGTDFAWAIDNGNAYESWSSVRTAEQGATVTGAYVIADADQTAGMVDHIDNLTFAGITFNS